MRNRTYGGVRGRKTKVGEKLLRFPPTRFLFILSIVLNKISTFLFNTNDFQPFSPAIRWEYNQKRSLYKCNKAQPSHEDCASNSFLFLFNF